MKLIDKDALVAEIERRIDKLFPMIGFATTTKGINMQLARKELENVLSFLDTLEVKEVDLEIEIDKEIETRWTGEYLFTSKFRESAKHFFELGLKAQKGD